MPITIPPSTNPTIIQTIEKDATWVKMHIATLLVSFCLIGGTAVGSVYGVEKLISAHDVKMEEKYNAQLAGEVANTKAAQDTLATTVASFNDTLHLMQTANAALAQSIANRNIQTQKQVKIDATLDSAETAQRLATQTSAKAGEIQVAANGSDLTIDLPTSRIITSDLDSLQTSQQNLVDTQKELDNTNQLYTASQQVVDAQSKTITAQNVEIAGQFVACQKEVSAVKAQARKSKLKFGAIMFVVGYLTGKFTPPFLH